MKEFSEDQRKHIEIIEATITRMSANSKQMKEWCVALIYRPYRSLCGR